MKHTHVCPDCHTREPCEMACTTEPGDPADLRGAVVTCARCLAAATMTYAWFRKKYPATRCFQPYDGDTRANHAASHRLTRGRRESFGERYYVHDLLPGVAFETAKMATTRAYEVYMAQHAAVKP